MRFDRAVKDTPELQRVIDLPQRDFNAFATDDLALEWTALLTTPTGKAEGARLNNEQAGVLAEAYECRGVWASLSVGLGKSLLSWLVPTVLDATRPVLILPAGLRDEIAREWAKYSKHWLAPRPPPRMISYQDLDQTDALTALERMRPDLVMLDESHSARRPSRAATKRLARYANETTEAYFEGRGPWVPFCAWTGTPGRLSILDFAPHLVWCLKDRAPVPLVHTETEAWASAIDEKGPRSGQRRVGVGALRRLIVDFGARPDALKLVDQAREAFCRRLESAPGVVIVSRDSCDQPLLIEQIAPPFDALIEANFERFRKYDDTPGGETVGDPLEAYRLETQLSLGYHGEWDPVPPVLWRANRKAWHTDCRRLIEASQDTYHPLDTMGAVAKAHPDLDSLRAWRAVEPQYTIDPKAVWHSGSVVEWVAAELRDGPPTLCFCWSVPFCEALEYVTGLDWYANKGKTRAGRYIGDAHPDRSAIVSGGANIQGRNLQHFSEYLYVGPPQSAQWLEQAFGRGHRQGQDKAVRIRVAVTSGGIADGFEKALREARFAKNTWRVEQKILRADITRADYDRSSWRFVRKEADSGG